MSLCPTPRTLHMGCPTGPALSCHVPSMSLRRPLTRLCLHTPACPTSPPSPTPPTPRMCTGRPSAASPPPRAPGPGIAGRDITDGHTDFYARFAGVGTVLAHYEPDSTQYDHSVTLTHLDILRNSTDAQGNALTVIVLEAPSTVRSSSTDFAAGYVNYYVGNNFVLVPEFGDSTTDAAAKSALESAYPGRTVVQLNIDNLAEGGGGIHCTTQQEPGTARALATTSGSDSNWGLWRLMALLLLPLGLCGFLV